VLHAALGALGWSTVHGPNVTGLGRLGPDDLAALWALLEDPAPPPPLAGLRALAPARAEGRLRGGNLSLLAHLCGTPRQPDLHDAVLLLEDVNEEPYRVDRMLTQLHHAGALAGVAGVAAGEFFGCGAPDEVERVLADRLGLPGVPVVTGLPVGHGARNRAVPLGARVTLDAGAGMLRFLAGAVH
jgi:muramoyltetrapeptide carboxypeptidase